MDIRETRKANLKRLIEERADGSVVRFSELVGIEGHTQLSRVLGPKASRNLGHTLARRIESALGLERGWMDKDHGPQQSGAVSLPSPRAIELARRIDALSMPAQAHIERMVESISGLVGNTRKRRRKKPS